MYSGKENCLLYLLSIFYVLQKQEAMFFLQIVLNFDQSCLTHCHLAVALNSVAKVIILILKIFQSFILGGKKFFLRISRNSDY